VREIQETGKILIYELQIPEWEPKLVGRMEGPILYENEVFKARYTLLSHGSIPSVAYLFEEPSRVKIAKFPYKPGPWIRQLKEAYEAGRQELEIEIDGQPHSSLDLFQHLYEEPGRRVGFVMDHLGCEENHLKIIQLCQGADTLFIEAYYRNIDSEMALKNDHSTAKLSGEVARRAGVKEVQPCHFSRRYHQQVEEVIEECLQAFKGTD